MSSDMIYEALRRKFPQFDDFSVNEQVISWEDGPSEWSVFSIVGRYDLECCRTFSRETLECISKAFSKITGYRQLEVVIERGQLTLEAYFIGTDKGIRDLRRELFKHAKKIDVSRLVWYAFVIEWGELRLAPIVRRKDQLNGLEPGRAVVRNYKARYHRYDLTQVVQRINDEYVYIIEDTGFSHCSDPNDAIKQYRTRKWWEDHGSPLPSLNYARLKEIDDAKTKADGNLS